MKQQALALADKLYNDNKKQVEIGTLAPIEIVSAEAQVARRQQELTASETRLLQQETVIKNVLSKNGVESPLLASARIVPTDRINIPEQEPVRADQRPGGRPRCKNRREVEQTQINIENTRSVWPAARAHFCRHWIFRPSSTTTASQANRTILPDSWLTPPADPSFSAALARGMGQLLRRNFPDYGVRFS